jgi:hypothetical protein
MLVRADRHLRKRPDQTAKQRQWQAFVRDMGIEVPGLGDVVSGLAAFLLPHARRAKALGAHPSVKGAP